MRKTRKYSFKKKNRTRKTKNFRKKNKRSHRRRTKNSKQRKRTRRNKRGAGPPAKDVFCPGGGAGSNSRKVFETFIKDAGHAYVKSYIKAIALHKKTADLDKIYEYAKYMPDELSGGDKMGLNDFNVEMEKVKNEIEDKIRRDEALFQFGINSEEKEELQNKQLTLVNTIIDLQTPKSDEWYKYNNDEEREKKSEEIIKEEHEVASKIEIQKKVPVILEFLHTYGNRISLYDIICLIENPKVVDPPTLNTEFRNLGPGRRRPAPRDLVTPPPIISMDDY